ncbi:MAG TPA: SMC-Scp complex subunit ScpB [Tepidisphaeraceae bacterium]|nr:SMC-Scp complex subunit ScpB [Tepidisphaeraceae bacterium]
MLRLAQDYPADLELDETLDFADEQDLMEQMHDPDPDPEQKRLAQDAGRPEESADAPKAGRRSAADKKGSEAFSHEEADSNALPAKPRELASDPFPAADESAADEVAVGEADMIEGSSASEDAIGGDGAVAGDTTADTIDASEFTPAQFGIIEALLLSTHHPLTAGRLGELLDLSSTRPIRKAVRELNTRYESTDRCFRIEQVAGGYQILTLPEFGPVLQKLHQREADARLTKAALETLAIIAYKQPILRANIEAIRGVACGETIRSLMEKHLVKIAGRAEEPGRPILYGTTKRFLELFGLNGVKDLPQPEALKQIETSERNSGPIESV